MQHPEWRSVEQFHTLSIQERISLGEDLTLLRFNESLSQGIAGQYVLLWLPRFAEKPYMISRVSPLEIIVQTKGPFSQLITENAFAQQLLVRGPFGTGYTLPPETAAQVTLIIDNTAGLSAGFHLLQELASRGHPPPKILMSAEFHSRIDPNLLTNFTVEMYDSQLFSSVLYAVLPRTEYLYFSTTAESSLATILEASAINTQLQSAQGIFVDTYIACAIGICGRCSREGWLAGKLPCTEGPVFDILKK